MAGKAIEFTDANFEASALQSDKPVLVDFWAVWCGPCRMVAPVVEALADEYEGRVTIGKLDVDSNKDTAVRYGIQSIPTLLFLKNGQEVDRIIGNADRNAIASKPITSSGSRSRSVACVPAARAATTKSAR